MTTKSNYLKATCFLCLSSVTHFAAAGIGEDTAAELTKYFKDTPQYCNSPSAPAFICSGILIRATTPWNGVGPKYNTWSPSPAAAKRGGMAFSYLRADTGVSHLASSGVSGYALYPITKRPESTYKYEVLCAYPTDGDTDERDDKGCGNNRRTTETEQLCQNENIFTADQWVNKYTTTAEAGKTYTKQCAFDVRDERDQLGAEAFYQSILTTPKIPNPFGWNEIVIQAWPQEQGRSLPIQAFFYVEGTRAAEGLKNAKYDQYDWFNNTERFIPIIKIALSKDPNATTFTYQDSDQAIPDPATVCNEYIKSASWVEQHAVGTEPPRNELALVVTPSDCGRTTNVDQVEAMYHELYKKYGQYLWEAEDIQQDRSIKDTRWRYAETSPKSMRRQLVCLMANYPQNPTWSLEPFRPYVTQEQAAAVGCNPVNRTDATPSDTVKGNCPYYIESATWVFRHDPGTNKKEWTLSVLPTACSREINKDNDIELSRFYNELFEKYGQSPQWKVNTGGMRPQVYCHLDLAKDKREWNLEPFRPNVTNQKSVEDRCNSI